MSQPIEPTPLNWTPRAPVAKRYPTKVILYLERIGQTEEIKRILKVFRETGVWDVSKHEEYLRFLELPAPRTRSLVSEVKQVTVNTKDKKHEPGESRDYERKSKHTPKKQRVSKKELIENFDEYYEQHKELFGLTRVYKDV